MGAPPPTWVLSVATTARISFTCRSPSVYHFPRLRSERFAHSPLQHRHPPHGGYKGIRIVLGRNNDQVQTAAGWVSAHHGDELLFPHVHIHADHGRNVVGNGLHLTQIG